MTLKKKYSSPCLSSIALDQYVILICRSVFLNLLKLSVLQDSSPDVIDIDMDDAVMETPVTVKSLSDYKNKQIVGYDSNWQNLVKVSTFTCPSQIFCLG